MVFCQKSNPYLKTYPQALAKQLKGAFKVELTEKV